MCTMPCGPQSSGGSSTGSGGNSGGSSGLSLTESLLCCGMVTVSKAHQLLQGLQASGDEGQQLTAVIEMCQVSSSTDCTVKQVIAQSAQSLLQTLADTALVCK